MIQSKGLVEHGVNKELKGNKDPKKMKRKRMTGPPLFHLPLSSPLSTNNICGLWQNTNMYIYLHLSSLSSDHIRSAVHPKNLCQSRCNNIAFSKTYGSCFGIWSMSYSVYTPTHSAEKNVKIPFSSTAWRQNIKKKITSPHISRQQLTINNFNSCSAQTTRLFVAQTLWNTKPSWRCQDIENLALTHITDRRPPPLKWKI